MNILVVADTHLGCILEPRLTELTNLLKQHEGTVIWLGDAFDTLRHETSYQQYKHLMKKGDLWIAGNHDYGQSQIRSLSLGKVYLTHGDMVDFGLGFARLQAIRSDPELYSKALPIERVLSKMRPWVLDDVYNFYQVLYELSDADVAAYNPAKLGLRFSTVMAYIKIFIKLLRTPVGIATVMDNVPTPEGEKFGGYVTHDPMKLLKLILYFHPEARLADTIVVGHTHHPIDEILTVEGKTYRFITLGAWVGDVDATYAQIKEDNTIEVIRI